MRVDLFAEGKRPWYFTIGLKLIKMRTGVYPGPPLTISYRPDLFQKDFVGYIMRAMHGSGGWDKGHAEMFASFVSRLNACNFWLQAHAAVAALNIAQETLDAVLEDWTTAEIPERTRAALRLLDCMTLHPIDLDTAFVNELRGSGLDDLAIREAANVGFHYNLINRVADAFDFPVPDGKQKERLATMLNISGKLLKGSSTDTVWVRGVDGQIRPTEVEHGREQMLSTDGKTTPALRRSVEAFVTAQWGHERMGVPPVPAELESYLKKLSLHAYRIVDEDIEALQNAGYSDEMIYEITIVGAIGAALVGLEKLFQALYDQS